MSYNPEKRSKRYYMLDRKDITNVRGIITSGEVMDELGLTNCGFERFVYQNKDYHGYYLVEVDEDEESSKFKEYKFFELNASRCPSRWYVTWDIKKIKIVDRQKYILSNNRKSLGKEVGLFEDGHLVKCWPSSRAAANELYISYQTVSDICKSRYKKKMYDLRYI